MDAIAGTARLGGAALAVALGLVACNSDTVRTVTPTLEITGVADEYHPAAGFDVTTLTAVLGPTPVCIAKRALFRVSNPSNQVLTLSAIEGTATAGKWTFALAEDPAANGINLVRVRSGEEWPRELGPGGSFLLEVTYSPTDIDGHDVYTLVLHSDADVKETTLTVSGTGVEPLGNSREIEVAYDTFVGPAPATCEPGADSLGNPGHVCTVPAGSAIAFGNIGLDTLGTKRIEIHNAAELPNVEDVLACDWCGLTVSKIALEQDTHWQVQSNDARVACASDAACASGFTCRADAGEQFCGRDLFAFGSSTATPKEIRPRSIVCTGAGDACLCDEAGFVQFALVFAAPSVQGDYGATLVIESDDDDERVIRVPITATALDAPVAVAQFKEYDPLGGPLPGDPDPGQYTNPNDIVPLARVYFYGGESFDPRDPNNPTLIDTWQWSIAGPPDVASSAYAEQGQGTSFFSFVVPQAGSYVVALAVTNDLGLTSGDTASSKVEFDVIPRNNLHVELTWDHPANDQDLHLVWLGGGNRLCAAEDCYWSSKRPVWFSSSPAGQGANPSLDRDDTNGQGPENIVIEDPLPGTYRIYVHYFSSAINVTTRNKVSVWLNRGLKGEYRRSFKLYDTWAVADIVWPEQGQPTVLPVTPADASGEVGQVSYMPTHCGVFP